MIDTLLTWAEPLFLRTVNVSIAASWLVLAVLLARLLLRRGPRWGITALWAVVGLRLIWPFSIPSPASLVPSVKTVDPATLYAARPAIQSGFRAVDRAVNPVLEQTFAPAPGASANPLQILVPLAALLWLAVAAGMGVYALAGWLRLRRRMSTAVRLEDNVYQSEAAVSPFILGVIRPRIYLPFSMSPRDMALVLAHERAHLARRDHWWKPLGFALLAVHWFNPLMWLAYLLLCRDIELACDQRVIRDLTAQDRADYSQALLDHSARRAALRACPLAFGEVGVKERVRRVLHYRKPALWTSVLAVLLCAIAAACFLTDPADPAAEPAPSPAESVSPAPSAQPETVSPSLSSQEADVSYTLPDGLTATAYDPYTGPAGGVLLKPDAYELVEGDLWGAAAEWRAAGMVARYYTDGLVEWDGDRIATVGEFYNHTFSEEIGAVDGLCAPGFLKKSNHDLYTAAELDALAQDGVDVEALETTSDYWYLWLARPGEETGWVLSLNAKNFTQEDLLAFAQSFSY